MNRELIEQQVVRVFRTTSLHGSDRDVGLAEPLGELGLGLDSLALLEFVTALEGAFQVPISDDIWTTRGQLALNDFVEIMARSAAEAPAGPARRRGAVAARTAPPSRRQRSARETRPGRRPLVRSLSRTLKSFSRRYYIIQFEISEHPVPGYSPRPGLRLRAAGLDDATALSAFWASFPGLTFNKQPMTLTLFERLLGAGHLCYAAWLGDEIVGWDWLWRSGFTCRYTGLRLEWPADTCYAGELREHPRFRGRGVGLALLACSLNEAKKLGYARQVCWVDARNRKMLSGAIQLLRFELVGQIRRTGRFPLSFSSWRHADQAGFGRTLIL